MTRADGSHILYETLVTPLYGPKETVTGALEVSRDVTASWRTARLLQARLALSEFATGHSLEALLRRALDQAEDLTASAIGFFHFLDEGHQSLSLQTWSTNTLATMCTAEPIARHYPVAQAGVWAECVHSGQPVVCNDYAALDRSDEHLPAGHAPVARFLSMPIVRGDQVVAVMGVGDKALPYDDADATMLAQFASAAWDVILRKRAEEATAVSLEKYRVLFESFPLGITISDKQGRIIEANAASERLLGLSVADHLQRTIDDPRWRIIRPDGSALPAEEYASVRALHEQQLVRDVRMGIVKPRQGVAWISATAAPIPLDDYGLAITYNDITEQQQLARLQAAQLTVSRVLADSPDFQQAMPGLLQTVTQELGWDGAELWLLDPATERLNRFWTWCRPDQPGLAHFTAESTAFTFAPHEGAPGIVLAENSPLWFLIPEHPTYPRALLAQACGIQTGLVVPIAAGSQVLAVLGLVSLACLPRDERMIECLVDLGRQIAQFAARKHAEAELHAERALLAQRVEERTADLSFANLQLGHALRAKDEFLANMSHELRTPLHGILTLSESLLTQNNGSLSSRQVRSLELIEQSGEHLLELINDILDLAKVEAGKLTVEPEPVDVGALCRSSVQLVRELATKKEVRLALDLNETDLRLMADGRRLKQVLVNLLSNAIKFTPMGGSVRLRVKPDAAAGALAFAVIDTGIGIAPDKLGLLFQPFTQLDSGLTRSHEGTGLGLALVRRLVELHGGTVRAESEGIAGRGSCFTVTLPWRCREDAASGSAPSGSARLSGEDAASGSAPSGSARLSGEDAPSGSARLSGEDAPSGSARPVPARAGTRTLLVAEDNELNRTALADYLEGSGFRVLTAANGLEAIDLATERRPDLILMDVQMPVVDGLEAMRRLRATPATATIPIVALTALAMVGDRDKCLAAGADAYLAKPISLRDMTAQVEALLR